MEIREAVARGDRWRERRRSRGFRPASSTPQAFTQSWPAGLASPSAFSYHCDPSRRRCDTLRGGEVVSRRAHNPKIAGSNPAPATTRDAGPKSGSAFCFLCDSGSSRSIPDASDGVRTDSPSRHQLLGENRPHQLVAHVGVSPLPPPAQGREDVGGRDTKVAATVAVVVSPAAAVLAHRDDHGPEEGPARRAGEAGRRFLGPSDRFRAWVQNENVTNSPSLAYGALTAQPDPIHGPHLSTRCPPDE